MKHSNISHSNREPKGHWTQSLTALIATVGLLSACSTSAWYEGMKASAQRECDKQAPGAREDCLSRLNKKSYDAYEKERMPTTP